MILTIEIPDYKPEKGFAFNWSDGFKIDLSVEGNEVLIKANHAGLESLANHLLNLAQSHVPVGHHFHLDEYNSLENGPLELIIEKTS